ncbi:diguanylate cyclase domain-containing protein [Gracilibacillus xinjiangensis]|uniref:Diguanylate cyclase domain-containing protein n=1 Tax=Gracilibacillus xinjiangensis TaxID=1193282 RepID=A0ABV8WTJ7_9BACI
MHSLNFPSNFSGKTIEEIMPDYSAKIVDEHYRQAITLKSSVTYEEKIELPLESDHTKKRVGWVESRITPLFNDRGECEHIVTVTREITERKNHETELRYLKEQYELIFKCAADAVFTFDERGNYLTVNPSFTKMFGWTMDEILINSEISILEHRGEFSEILTQLKEGKIIENHTSKRRTKNNEFIHVLSSYTPIMNGGKMVGGIAVYKDITKMDELRTKLKKSEEKYKIIVENSNDLIKVSDKDGQILYASPSHEKILGFESNFLIGKSFLSFVYREDMEKVRNFVLKIMETGMSSEIDYRRLNKNGEVLWVNTKGGPVINVEGTVENIVFVSRDISIRVEREQELEAIALYDELTGLAGRTLFQESLQKAMGITDRLGKMTALLILDGDNFKAINDNYGHSVGDEVIKEFGKRIHQNVRVADTVSRMGGDEFQVVLPGLDSKQEAQKVCQRIINSMKQPIRIGSNTLMITVSIGVSYYTKKGISEKKLMKQADEALYFSKRQMKGNFSEFTEKTINI